MLFPRRKRRVQLYSEASKICSKSFLLLFRVSYLRNCLSSFTISPEMPFGIMIYFNLDCIFSKVIHEDDLKTQIIAQGLLHSRFFPGQPHYLWSLESTTFKGFWFSFHRSKKRIIQLTYLYYHFLLLVL